MAQVLSRAQRVAREESQDADSSVSGGGNGGGGGVAGNRLLVIHRVMRALGCSDDSRSQHRLDAFWKLGVSDDWVADAEPLGLWELAALLLEEDEDLMSDRVQARTFVVPPGTVAAQRRGMAGVGMNSVQPSLRGASFVSLGYLISTHLLKRGRRSQTQWTSEGAGTCCTIYTIYSIVYMRCWSGGAGTCCTRRCRARPLSARWGSCGWATSGKC
jgi:hypothetical protein